MYGASSQTLAVAGEAGPRSDGLIGASAQVVLTAAEPQRVEPSSEVLGGDASADAGATDATPEGQRDVSEAQRRDEEDAARALQGKLIDNNAKDDPALGSQAGRQQAGQAPPAMSSALEPTSAGDGDVLRMMPGSVIGGAPASVPPSSAGMSAAPAETSQGAGKAGRTAGRRERPVAAFLQKLYQIVQTSAPVCSWSNNGTSFLIKDNVKFSSDVLPKYFRTSNFSSFVRQLHFYGTSCTLRRLCGHMSLLFVYVVQILVSLCRTHG